MQDDGLLDGLTALDISDTSQLSFTYQGRVDVLLGNSSSLDYKLRLAAKILTDPDKGLSGSDRGTLDVSDQLETARSAATSSPMSSPLPRRNLPRSLTRNQKTRKTPRNPQPNNPLAPALCRGNFCICL